MGNPQYSKRSKTIHIGIWDQKSSTDRNAIWDKNIFQWAEIYLAD